MTTEAKTKLLPFDLEVALKEPERVVHKGGDIAVRVFHIPELAGENEVLIVWSDGGTGHYSINGLSACLGGKVRVFILPKVKKGWVNIYSTDSIMPAERGCLMATTSHVYPTREVADRADKDEDMERLACIEVEWEE